jgi:NhaC family Na+:H+ antiporter
MVITLLIFLFMGFNLGQADDLQDVGPILDAISGVFDINLWLFIVPLIVIWLIVKRVPAIPALLAGTLLGGLFAIIFQPDVIRTIAGNDLSVILANYVAVLKAMYGTVAITTGNAVVDELLATSGMSGMLNTIWLILSAMIFGGVMDACGMLKRITKSIIHLAHSTGSLVASTAVSCIFFNLTASDQYLAIVVPGKMFEKIYRQRGLAPQNLSRTLEDSGTVTSVLVPWNTCGATQSRILGVATLEYIPYCFFNIISPIMTVFFAYAGLKIAKLIPQKTETDNN